MFSFVLYNNSFDPIWKTNIFLPDDLGGFLMLYICFLIFISFLELFHEFFLFLKLWVFLFDALNG